MKEDIKNLIVCSRKVVGMKQVMRGIIEDGNIRCVILARNADEFVKNAIVEVASTRKVQIVYADDKAELGRLAGIEVDASCVGLLN